MTSTTLTADQICLSPFNVRKNVPLLEDTIAIEDSILVEGLRVPIEVHQMRGSKTKWGAFAGRRRLFAIKRLIERGQLAADWPVPVAIHDDLSDAELIERSITENLLRKDMEPHELCAGVASAAARGHDVATIARNLGQRDEREVARWVRLGRLAKPVFDAFAAGRIRTEQARAFAATEDQDLQAITFEQLLASYGASMSPEVIRRALKVGDAVQRRQLLFVGEIVYRGAGGRYELDLFAESSDDRGRIVDEGLLARLVEEKMAVLRDGVREETGRRDLRFVPTPPESGFGGHDHLLAVAPRFAAGRTILPDGDVVACIEINGEAEPSTSYWWPDRKAKFGSEKPAAGRDVTPGNVHTLRPGIALDDRASPGARREADAAIKEDTGASQDTIQIMRALRRAVLRAILVADADTGGDVSTDYLVWAQIRATLDMKAAPVGMTKLPTEDIGGFDLAARAREQLEVSGVARSVGDVLRELSSQPFITLSDLDAAFLTYRAASRRLKELSAAIVAGQALARSLNAEGYRLPIHDLVAAEARGDEAVRAHWTPTATFLDLFPRAQQLALAEDMDAATLKRWSGLKPAAARDAVLDHLTSQADWVHPLLRFAGSSTTAPQQIAEAAE